ncbi:hypothetical protein Mp_4g09830 [Marchantia polymorpha subsp. ruderalis]|uniref:Uncharacterized protein n=2 Tax=Marchantia polymorpha TaxID=3197 RepID=A0AAF6B887_MARPO|nr:hypothetical protein MARPO_0132s0026 [Marchantia polymorpha]BBN08221.1 hypothetical protein Mp_4g09830 [Marchantia polymorpha subsp. ruderalis]|eukprot:PTQ29951.1 hypothetical protein MARPO_0132s0026 [Marchantia polymorpha]
MTRRGAVSWKAIDVYYEVTMCYNEAVHAESQIDRWSRIWVTVENYAASAVQVRWPEAASGKGAAATARLIVSQGVKVRIAEIASDAGKKISSKVGFDDHNFHSDVTKEADVAGAVVG